jgi:hypothetical protein
MAHHYHEEDRNRVLVGLPARLEAARSALRENEKTLEQLRQLYGQRLLLNDRTVLDQIGDLLGCPRIEGDKPRPVDRPHVSSRDGCPACTGGLGSFCTAHDWHNQ